MALLYTESFGYEITGQINIIEIYQTIAHTCIFTCTCKTRHMHAHMLVLWMCMCKQEYLLRFPVQLQFHCLSIQQCSPVDSFGKTESLHLFFSFCISKCSVPAHSTVHHCLLRQMRSGGFKTTFWWYTCAPVWQSQKQYLGVHIDMNRSGSFFAGK